MTNEDLAKICEYVLTGLSEKEACILSDVDPSVFQMKKESNPKVNEIIEKAKIQFKLAHIKEIQNKKNGNNSQWLLEKLRPEEFGNKTKDTQFNVNIISQIINSIQNGEQASRIIPRTRGEYLAEESNKQLEVNNFLK